VTGRAPGTLRVLALLAAVVQLVVLYAPRTPGIPLFPGADKLIHLLVFAVPVLLCLLAGLPPRLVVVGFAVHAGLSEVIQGLVLPDRSADARDVVADLVGVLVGWWGWHRLRRGVPSARW
jgi:VanZ family protein